jgi:hypothetical protein
LPELDVKELEQAKDEMLEMMPLPEGYKIEVDTDTRNILVSGKNLGFCITNLAVQAGLHKTTYIPTLQRLIEIENSSGELQ